MQPQQISTMVPSLSIEKLEDGTNELLNLCWKHQECQGCLSQSPCSWCPTVRSTIALQTPLNPKVLNLRSQYRSHTDLCSNIIQRRQRMSFVVRGMGAESFSVGLPCLDHHSPHLYCLSVFHIYSDWICSYGYQGLCIYQATLFDGF